MQKVMVVVIVVVVVLVVIVKIMRKKRCLKRRPCVNGFRKRRFGHIAHKVGEELIISHGNNDGRLLSDCWALDLMELRWKRKELKWPGSPCADAASVATADGEIYLFRGVGTKNDEDALLVTKATTSSGGDGKNTIVAEKMMMTVSKLDLSDIEGNLMS